MEGQNFLSERPKCISDWYKFFTINGCQVLTMEAIEYLPIFFKDK